MAERPILFNGVMVRAILAGRKTQTRRAVKPQPHIDACGNFCWDGWNYGQDIEGRPLSKSLAAQIPSSRTGRVHCPYGKVGDRLWVRETWGTWDQGFDTAEESGFTVYRADDERPEPKRWRPSIHMPRWACRLVLEITNVRVERLQKISEPNCEAEGATGGHGSIPGYGYAATPKEHFEHIWTSTGGDWDANPWVWVIEFKRVTGTEGR